MTLMTANPKFLLLVRRLKLPLPYVRGVLDTLWDTCHANADPVIGTPEEVEAAAQWPGEDGVLFEALKRGGWVEPSNEAGKWMVHDYWDHCPAFVWDRLRKRRHREDKRRTMQECPGTIPGQSRDNLTPTPTPTPVSNTPPTPRKRGAVEKRKSRAQKNAEVGRQAQEVATVDLELLRARVEAMSDPAIKFADAGRLSDAKTVGEVQGILAEARGRCGARDGAAHA